MAKLTTYLALLRGINVGGKNILPMKDLAEFFIESGCTEVRTFIQSGNVIFRASPSLGSRAADLVAAKIKNRFGHQPPMVLRTDAELEAAITNNPFISADADENHLHVMFLADKPTPVAVKALDPNRSPPERFLVVGREIYLCLPNGAGKSKLTNAYFDSKLDTISTLRNWRTVTKLNEMMRVG